MHLGRWLDDFRDLPRATFLLAGARCVNTFGFSIVMPYLAFHLAVQRGVGLTGVGIIYAVAGLVGALAQLVGGELSDRLGRRVVMVSSLALRTVIMALLGLAVLRAAPVLVIGALVVINAILRSAFEPAAQAQVSALAGPSGRIAVFGLQRIGVNLGWALGPALGGFFAARSYGLMFFVASAVTLGAMVVCAQVPDPDGPVESGQRLRLRDLVGGPRPRAFLLFLAVTLAMSVLTTQLYSTMSVYAMGPLAIPERRFGLLYTINGIFVVTLQGPAVRLLRRIGIARSLAVGPLIYSLGYLTIGLAHDFNTLGCAVVLVTLGEVITEVAETVAAVTLGDPARPGRALGVFGLLSSLGNSLGPAVGGLLYDHLPGHPLKLWGTLAAIGIGGALGYRAVGVIDDQGGDQPTVHA